MSKKNPIEQELAKLDELWEEFLSSDKPVFHCYIPVDAAQLAKTWVTVRERFEDDSSDLFIGLHSNFNAAERYGFELADEMNISLEAAFQQAIREEQEEGVQAANNFTWSRYDLSLFNNGYHALLDCTQRLFDNFGEHIDCVCLVVMPNQVTHVRQYIAWWESACLVHRDYELWPKKLKLLVFEIENAPLLQSVAEQYPEQVYCSNTNTDMKGAIDKILDEADNGSPGAKLRKTIVEMNYAVGEQNIPHLEAQSEAAIPIAKENNFLDMLATILMIRAAGYLNTQQFDKAIADYQSAQQYCEEGVSKNILGCDKLQLQSTLCEGTALFSAKRYSEAAVAYEKAAVLAEQQNDKLMTLEGWRMASFCLEMDKQKKPAWEKAKQAMEAGRKMDEEEMRNSTMPFVGEAMIRLAPDYDSEKQVQAEFAKLLGDDWRERQKQQQAQMEPAT